MTPLNLDPHQVMQADAQLESAEGVVVARLPEAYQWLLVPVQNSPQAALEWQAIRLTGADALAVRASKKLRNDELLVTSLAGTRLRMEMDRVPLWRGEGQERVEVKQLAEDFARYPYLPRLSAPAVLAGAADDGLGVLTWAQETFAYADAWDESAGRYRGLRCGQPVTIPSDSLPGLLVRPAAAERQQAAETPKIVTPVPHGPGANPPGPGPTPPDVGPRVPGSGPTAPPPAKVLRRFYGTVTLGEARVGRDAGRVAEEVIAHLVGLTGAKVTVTLEIEAEIPAGAPENVVRTVTENCRTLKFGSQGFEQE